MPKSVFLAGKPPQFEINVPGDGTCLFYSCSFAYLLPTVQNPNAFRARFIKLFGEEVADSAEENRNRLLKYDGSPEFISKNTDAFEILVNVYFRKRVVNFMRSKESELIKFISDDETFSARMARMADPSRKEWGDQLEIEAISQFLESSINVYHYLGEFLMPNPVHGEQFTNEIHLVHTTSDERIQYAKNHYHFIIDQQFVLGFNLAAEQAEKKRLAEEAAKRDATAAAARLSANNDVMAAMQKAEEALLNRAKQMSQAILAKAREAKEKAKASSAEADKNKPLASAGNTGAPGTAASPVLQFSQPSGATATSPILQTSPPSVATVTPPVLQASQSNSLTTGATLNTNGNGAASLVNKPTIDSEVERVLSILKQEGYKSRGNDTGVIGILKPVIQGLMNSKLEISGTNLHDAFGRIKLTSPTHQLVLSVLACWAKKEASSKNKVVIG